MAGYSIYPEQLDTSLQLPVATDGLTGVNAEVVNRLRDAILAIEAELAANPSGTYGSVKDRLDALTNSIQAILLILGSNPQGIYADLTLRLLAMQAQIDKSGGGGSTAGISKYRAYSNSIITAAVNTNTTVPLSSVSSLFTPTQSSLSSNAIFTAYTGLFNVSGQICLAPTVSAVSGINIDILKNTTVVHSIKDFGATWSVGASRTFYFNFILQLTSGDSMSMRWNHTGSLGSITTNVIGDNLTWLAISSL